MREDSRLYRLVFNSPLWVEDSSTRIVWIAMMAMADKNGLVETTIPSLAHFANVSPGVTDGILEKLQRNDNLSGGPFLEKTDTGYRILNFDIVSEKIKTDRARSMNAERQRRFKERRKSNTEGR